MLNLTRLHLGIAHESQFQGLGITGIAQEIEQNLLEPHGVRGERTEILLRLDNANESRCANAPSTPRNGVRTPAASQIDCSLFAIVPLYHAPSADGCIRFRDSWCAGDH